MPSATRQATPGPGPSTTSRSNAKPLKRSHAAASSNAQGQAQDSSKENAPDGREPKKMRMDPNAAANATAASSATTNGRLNARSASVVSSAAENGQQNGERGGRAKNKRRRKKKRTPVVAQASTASVVEMVVAPTTHQRLANQSQAQPSQSQSLPTAGTANEQSRGKGRESKKKHAKEEDEVDVDEDTAMEPVNDVNDDYDEGGDDNAGNDEPPPPDKNKEDEDEDDDTPRISSSEKGKGKAKMDVPAQGGSYNTATTSVRDGMDTSSELSSLREELARQSLLVTRHQSHLNQSQQSLTCQICLDLLHRPYALSPCGHVTCYPCLVRWFTAPRNPNANEAGPSNEAENEHSVDHLLDAPLARRGSYMRRSKTCPLCRTIVSERPVEMWTIKAMVASLVRSGLGDLPVPPPTQPEVGPSSETTAPGQRARDTDPWRNIFRRVRPGAAGGGGSTAGGFFEFLNGLQHAQPDVRVPARRLDLHQIFGQNAVAVLNANANANGNANANANGDANANPAGNAENDAGDPAQVGMFDQEDGIYRCIQCMHEIWNGICTACHRRYPAHRALMEPQNRGGRAPRFHLATAAANRRPMRPVMGDDHESDSDGDGIVDFVVDDVGLSSEDEEQQQRDIEDHNHLVMRALMGDDIEDEEDEDEDDVYGYDALERALAAEEHQQFGDEDDDEDGEGGEGAFADIPIWRDWGDDHDVSDDDMDDFYVHSDDAGDEDPGLFRQAFEEARVFGGHMRMGGLRYNPDFDHGDSDEEDSQYGGSFIDDNDGPSHDEASSESGTDLEGIGAQPNHLRNNRADIASRVARRPGSQINEVATESDSDGEVQIVESSNRRPRAGHSTRTRVILDDDDDDEEEEVEVVTELRGTGNAAASGSGSNRESRTRSHNTRGEENDRPAPAAAAAAAAMRRAHFLLISDDEDDQPRAARPSRTTRASGSGNAEAGPSGGSKTSRRR